MLLRLMFVLLIALNIAVAAWLLLGDRGTHAVDPSDASVPKLKLLAELPASVSTTALLEPKPATDASIALPAVPSASAPASASTPTSTSTPMPSTALSSVSPGPTATVPASAATASQHKPTEAAPKLAKKTSPASPATSARAAIPEAPESPHRSYRCLAIGPFGNQVDLRAARTAIASHTVRSRQRQDQATESHGWRVFLPTQPSRELAQAQAKRLDAKGIKDYFVVTAQGELQNSVALGLFHDPANARKRRDEVIAAGFPARMAERTETTPVWWLDVVVPDEATADLRRSLRQPSVTSRPTGCF